MESSRNSLVRIAVASDDGETIRQHFGRASRFLIYEIGDGAIRLVETREHEPAFHSGRPEHSDSRLAENVDLVSDCRAVLAAEIGSVAQAELARRDILSFQVTGLIGPILNRVSQNIGRILLQQRDSATPFVGKAV